MTVYHGSSIEVRSPNISYSKQYLDFGKGFYVTSIQSQAKKWAERKSLRYGGKGIVNIYNLQDNLTNIKILKFDNEDEKSLDFVCACRKGSDIYKQYDLIIGRVADDDVFKTVNMYYEGLWDKQRTIQELRYYKENNQICIINQNVLDSILTFVGSYEV